MSPASTAPTTSTAPTAPAGLQVAWTRAELAALRAGWSGSVAVVMTMGALHDGHDALLRAAAARADHVIATIFVNPLQFGPTEDFDRYPRTIDDDLAVCRRAGVRAVFAPARAEVYPDGEPQVRVDPGPIGEILEGASRPGFFHGVLTVVLKLLQITRPDLAFFGEKDYQQLTLVRRLVRDFDLPVAIVGVPTVRESDGLARSSRNRYLSPQQRQVALGLAGALRAGVDAATAGVSADEVLAAGRAAFDQHTGGAAELDYLALTDPELGPAVPGPARLLIAARVGDTRLIDNTPVELAGSRSEGS
ncbi:MULTISPECIES: pantoate--beta-alanine ligase [unclassified Solwaraspora]|uniref:pantoate--beta-alanine ligase n=1 Tax=unclassified Solwaraspora TaxID=2627926 RepID=UPI00248C2099|nr:MULTISPECIES: pantoate--beta-alanine ligase [unclassified Solwaraspora]WBC00525.1 pantoate--beta-alanine ligase [Solwaraspora sp. WMMA2059]WBC23862.1 pantoate--beta-alanine ligase [Solwaraspora sp. WMMA2080]WJK37920.1 pantoate--beta-alanine ligase [Solwaraspora sp. WMMA2065]